MIVNDISNPALYSVVVEGEPVSASRAVKYLEEAAVMSGGKTQVVNTTKASTEGNAPATHDMLVALPEAGVSVFEGFMRMTRNHMGVKADMATYDGDLRIAKGNLLFSLMGDDATGRQNAVRDVQVFVQSSGGKVLSIYKPTENRPYSNVHADMPANMHGSSAVTDARTDISTRNNTLISVQWAPVVALG
jgi:hypothetical protein